MRQTVAEPVSVSAREITIEPVTRIEGHARIGLRLDENGDVAEARVHIMSMRGFEKFIEGRAAEEVPASSPASAEYAPGSIILLQTKRLTSASDAKFHPPDVCCASLPRSLRI